MLSTCYPPDIHLTIHLCLAARSSCNDARRIVPTPLADRDRNRKRKGCLWSGSLLLISYLEWEVAALVAACNGIKGSRVSHRSCCCLSSGCGSGSRHLRTLRSRCHSTLLYAPCADRGVPTTVELARLDVKRNRYHIINLARVVLDTILSEYLEAHFTRVLLLCLQYIRLYFPRIARLAGAALLRQYLNDFSDYVHFCS